MISSQPLIDKICNKINQGGLTDLETCQTSNALAILSNPVVSVPNKNSLPSVIEYADRMIYVVEENRYYYSNGYSWTSDLTSNISVIASQIWSWGYNASGQLGDGTVTIRPSPVSIVGGFTDWCQVSAGNSHNLALRANGTLWAWGSNGSGRLGDGTTTTRSSPVSVVGGFTDWCRVSAGGNFSLGLRTNGTLWAWGNNTCGQLGSGTTISRSSPGSVLGGFTDWCQVSAGSCHSIGLRSDGTLWSWGRNSEGQLGDGTLTAKSSPVSVVGGFTDWCQISAGCLHTHGIRTDGTLWSWGSNDRCQLGDGTNVLKSSPVSVLGGFSDWCQVSASCGFSAALRTNGTIWAWGYNSRGQLGDGTAVNKSSPVSVVGGFTDWCQVSTGDFHSVAVRTNGTVWSWGYSGGCGRLGNGSTTGSQLSPVSVLGGFTDWYRVSAGSAHTISIRQLIKGF